MKNLLRIVFVGAFLVGGGVNAGLPQDEVDRMISTARAGRLPLQHQLTYLLGAVDDLGDPRDQKSNGIDNLRDPLVLAQARASDEKELERARRLDRKARMPFNPHYRSFTYEQSERVVTYLTSCVNNELATSQEYIERTFTTALQNFEANIRAQVNVTVPPSSDAEESEHALSRRISIVLNISSVENGLDKAKASIAAWKDTYKAQDVGQMDWRQLYDFKKSVLAVLKGLDDSERTIIGFGSY